MNLLRNFRLGVQALALLLLTLASQSASASAAITPTTAVEGRLRIQIEDYKDSSRTRHFLETALGRVELLLDRVPGNLRSGDRVRAQGRRLRSASNDGKNLVLEGAQVSASQTLPSATLPGAKGQQSLAVVLVNFSDDTSQPITAAAANSLVFGSVDAYYRENSSEQTWLSGQTFGWVTIALSKTVCDPDRLAAQAATAVAATGGNLSGFARKLYLFPKNACGWSGLGDVGGSNTQAWINNRFVTQVVAHELGHNLGLRHAHALNCDSAPMGNTCTTLEYGDAADTMGNIAAAHVSPYAKEMLGWLNDGISPPILTASSAGRFVIEPYSSNGFGPKAVKIPRGNDSSGRMRWYYVEYRQPIGADAVLTAGNLTQGVIVRTATQGDATTSTLLDMTPGSYPTENTRELQDAALLSGRVYQDAAGIAVSVVALGLGSATIDVSFAGAPVQSCVRVAPSVSIGGAASAVAAGISQAYPVTVTNRDSSYCGASTFALAGSVPSGWTGSLGAGSVSLSPGAASTTSFTVTSPSSAAAGTYGVGVGASSAASGTGQASSTYSVAPPTTPSAPLSETVTTNQASYLTGESVTMTANVSANSQPVSGASVIFKITKPNGSVWTISATTSASGVAIAKLRLNKQKDPLGSYSLLATAVSGAQQATANTSFSVR